MQTRLQTIVMPGVLAQKLTLFFINNAPHSIMCSLDDAVFMQYHKQNSIKYQKVHVLQHCNQFTAFFSMANVLDLSAF